MEFGFEQKFWWIDRFGEKKARIGGFAYPYSPPPKLLQLTQLLSLRKRARDVQKAAQDIFPLWTRNDKGGKGESAWNRGWTRFSPISKREKSWGLKTTTWMPPKLKSLKSVCIQLPPLKGWFSRLTVFDKLNAIPACVWWSKMRGALLSSL